MSVSFPRCRNGPGLLRLADGRSTGHFPSLPFYLRSDRPEYTLSSLKMKTDTVESQMVSLVTGLTALVRTIGSVQPSWRLHSYTGY